MNTDVEVRWSPIDGKGVFALRDFEQGETVLTWDTSHVIDDIDAIPEADRDHAARFEGKWIIMQEPMRYMNHSCESNTRSNGGRDVALRHINAGEEVTSDYRPEMKAGERMECRCGTASCKGFIVGTAE